MIESQHPFLAALGDHKLRSGRHDPDDIRNGSFCALECAALARGSSEPSDSPYDAGLPDIRPLNDARWSSDEVRTEHLTRVVMAWWDVEMTSERARYLAEQTIRRVLPIALRAVGLDAEATRCERDDDVRAAARDARAAAYTHASAARASAARDAAAYATDDAASAAAYAAKAARAAAGDAAAYATRDAAYAAGYAAYAAANAARAACDPDAVLISACDVWCEAARL